ncbi:amidohydrolase [Candidatus Bathyarchaeota archaeon]|nr:MAG: amidohydrolase [Candidatus Bathyarchaeota archaeon]
MNIPIIDAHAHYGKWFFPIYADSIRSIKNLMRRFNIKAAVCSSSKAIVYDFIEGNRELFQSLDPSSGIYGYVTVNPNYLELSKDEIERYLELPEFRGVKFHTAYSGVPIDSKEFKYLVEYAEPYDKPFLLHTYSQRDVKDVEDLAKRFGGIKFIMGHMGGTETSWTGKNWKLAISVASEYSNIYLEMCMTRLEAGKIEEAVEKVGSQRILYGSDMTLLNPAHTIGMIMSSEINREEKERIFYVNAKGLFKI